MNPSASIHSAAPYVLQESRVRIIPAKTADGASGSRGATAFTKRPSQRAVGRQTSTRMVATAASPASARRSGGALWGGGNPPTPATPPPRETAASTKAAAAAGAAPPPAPRATATQP